MDALKLQTRSRRYLFRKATERFAQIGMVLCTAVTVFFLLTILGYVIYHGASAIDWEFLTALPLPAGETGGGIANALVGSVLVVAVATLMAIVVGLFAYALVVRSMGSFSGFSGSVAYAFIMIPIILITSHEAFRLVPSSLREASLALGVPNWRTILGVVLPVSSRALLTGAVLAVSKALGEAAPMLFTAFGNPFWNLNLKKPIATVPLLIYTYATSPYDDWHKKAWAASFVLMMVVLFTSVLTRAFLRGKSHE